MLVRGITVGVLAAAALATQASAVAEPARQSYSDVFTTTEPGAATGRNYTIEWFNPEDPEGKPPAFSHLRVELAKGARFDTTAIPQCKATDAELMLAGESACPAESKVATDTTLVDSGAGGPARFYNFDFAFFNNQDELILLSTVRETGSRVVIRGQIGTNTIDVEVPIPLPGTPPDGGAAKLQKGEWPALPGYITTPPTCPESGHWVNRVTYTYRDGVTQTAESKSPCERPADRQPPRVRAKGIPRDCVTTAFRARLRISDASRLRAVRVRLDGRRIATTTRKKVAVRVPAHRVDGGRHTLAVTAVDEAGNRAERRFRFNRCR